MRTNNIVKFILTDAFEVLAKTSRSFALLKWNVQEAFTHDLLPLSPKNRTWYMRAFPPRPTILTEIVLRRKIPCTNG